jgi:hypothetical protein
MQRRIGLNLGCAKAAAALLELAYWLNTEARTTPGLVNIFSCMDFIPSLGVHLAQHYDNRVALWRVTACA